MKDLEIPKEDFTSNDKRRCAGSKLLFVILIISLSLNVGEFSEFKASVIFSSASRKLFEVLMQLAILSKISLVRLNDSTSTNSFPQYSNKILNLYIFSILILFAPAPKTKG